MSKVNYSEEMIAGLNPVIPMQEIGKVFRDTTQDLANKFCAEFGQRAKLPEFDKAIIVPKVARNAVGASELVCYAYFYTNNSGGNIFYKGKGGKNNRTSNGKINMIASAGYNQNGSGPYTLSPHFNETIGMLCRTNDQGRPIINVKTVQNGVACVELDANAVIAYALGITSNDAYDFDIISVVPIGNTTNFSIAMMKYISNDGNVHNGRNSKINYNRIEQEQFRKLNGGNGNGGRNY